MSSVVPDGFTVKQARRFLEKENRSWPKTLCRVPREKWPPMYPSPDAVFRSSKFAVQVFNEAYGLRLTVNRCEIDSAGDWVDGITWDELNAIKSELGYGDWYGVEIYPPSKDLVNVANMRHLWLLSEPLAIGWKAGQKR
jgi:hypothetical protein